MNKKMMKCCVTLSLCLGFSLPMAAQVAMHYQKMVQGKDGYQSRFVLKNTSGQPLKTIGQSISRNSRRQYRMWERRL